MNDTNEYCFLPIVYSFRINDCMKEQLIVSLCKLQHCMSLTRHRLSYYAIDFLLVLMINHCAGLKVHLSCHLQLSKGATVNSLMLLNVNTYANSDIESSCALMKLMEVLMNVYSPYSFNC